MRWPLSGTTVHCGIQEDNTMARSKMHSWHTVTNKHCVASDSMVVWLYGRWTLWLLVFGAQSIEVVYARRRRPPESLVACFADGDRPARLMASQRDASLNTASAVHFTATPAVMLHTNTRTTNRCCHSEKSSTFYRITIIVNAIKMVNCIDR